MPSRGESTQIGKYLFKVLSADSRRIYLLEVSLVDEQDVPQQLIQDQGC